MRNRGSIRLLRAATVLDRTDDVDRYTQLLSRIQTAFWGRFYDPVTGGLRHLGSPQTSHAIALEADLVPAEHRAPLLDAIVGDLQMRGWQQTTGEIGHVYLIRALARAGRSDVLHRIYNRTATGSYGAMVAAGLTTLPERWDGSAADSASLAHAMLGHVMEWFYGYVAGIRQGPDSIAWSDIVIGPNPGDLTSAQAALDTPRGPVSVQWTVDRRDLTITTTIPPGPPARLVLPGGSERPLAPGTAVTVVRYR